MKFLLFLSFIAVLTGKAQDTIILNNRDKLVSLVLLIDKDSIRYKPFADISGPDVYISNLEAQLIKYKNGSMINMDSLYKAQHGTIISKTKNSCFISGNSEQMYQRGKADAETNYPNKQALSMCAGGAFALLGPFGVIPAGVILFFPPLEKNLAYPCSELWENEDYRCGYIKKARKLKRRQIAAVVAPLLILSNYVYHISS